MKIQGLIVTLVPKSINISPTDLDLVGPLDHPTNLLSENLDSKEIQTWGGMEGGVNVC